VMAQVTLSLFPAPEDVLAQTTEDLDSVIAELMPPLLQRAVAEAISWHPAQATRRVRAPRPGGNTTLSQR
jgi:hypothetical protein